MIQSPKRRTDKGQYSCNEILLLSDDDMRQSPKRRTDKGQYSCNEIFSHSDAEMRQCPKRRIFTPYTRGWSPKKTYYI
jgi:hypothetical protein